MLHNYQKPSKQQILSSASQGQQQKIKQTKSENATQHHQTSQFLPYYLQKLGSLQEITKLRQEMLQKNSKIQIDDNFCKSIKISIIETDFQSYQLLVQYGNYKTKISVIFTQISNILFQDCIDAKGNFGIVNYFHFQDVQYAMKIIQIPQKYNESGLYEIYQEYFMNLIAEALQAGPRVIALFGYDIVVTKNKAFFIMEKCGYPIYQNQKHIQIQLKKKLKIMHSIGFVHVDIKPANIAYSHYHNSYVFIDFGISKIIKQKLGEKKNMKFEGTLAYCSEQMKGCYTLHRHRFVDLYYNDLQALQKCIKFYKYKKSSLVQTHIQSYKQHDQLNQISIQILSINNMESLKNLINIFQLKHILFTLKQNLSQKILQIIFKATNMKVTILQILQSSNYQLFNQSQILKIKIQQIKKYVYQQNFKAKQLDSYLYSIFNEQNKAELIYNLMPIEQILSMSCTQFAKLMNNQNWAYKLFLVFSPFYQKQKIKCHEAQRHAKQSMIVDKIYSSFKVDKDDEIYSRFQQFFCFKVRFALIFFYEKLKNLRNMQALLEIRMLFISVQDFIHVQIVQDQILNVISNVNIKFLKIVQFSLFWDIQFVNCDYKRRQKLICAAENIISQNKNKDKQQQIFEMCIICFNILNRSFQFQLMKQQKTIILNKIQHVQQNYKKTIYNEPIQNIKYLWQINFRTQNLQMVQQLAERDLNLRLQIKLYFRYLNAMSILKIQQQQLKSIIKIFMPLHHQFQVKYLQLKIQKQILISNTLDCLFYINKNHAQMINSICWSQLCFIFVQSKKYFIPIIQRNHHNFQLVINQAANGNGQLSEYLIYCKLSFILSMLFLMYLNVQKAPFYQKLIKFDCESLIQMLSNLLNLIKQNYHKIVYSQFQILPNSQYSSQDLNQKCIAKIQSFIKIIQLRFSLALHGPTVNAQKKVKEVLAGFGPLPSKNHKSFVIFMLIYEYYKQQLEDYSSNPYGYAQQTINYICRKYIENGQYLIFKDNNLIFSYFMVVNNARGLASQSLAFMNKYIKNTNINKQFVEGINIKTFVNAVKSFIKSLQQQQLLSAYHELRQNFIVQIKYQNVCNEVWLHGYFLLKIFQRIYKNLNSQQCVQIISKILIVLPKMCQQCLINLRPSLCFFALEFNQNQLKQRKKHQLLKQYHKFSSQKVCQFGIMIKKKLKKIQNIQQNMVQNNDKTTQDVQIQKQKKDVHTAILKLKRKCNKFYNN